MISRRELLSLALAAPFARALTGAEDLPNVHLQILEIAAEQERKRRARFAAVKSPADLAALQKELRDSFLKLLDWTPEAQAAPPTEIVGTIEAEDYVVEKLLYQSRPGYFVPALLYRPRKITGKVPGVISPCGHSPTGKAANSYQILHVNLARRGYIVLTYDPVGQGERSQFWDASKAKSRFNLTCGEHSVLGNPLYLLGTSLARYRIADGIRAIDYLAAHPNVDATRIACVGNSGGGALTSYIAALDPRVHTAAIGCYITTLPRRMGNRIQRDPDSDPEQDIFRFVSEGIDHAGLLALRAPRPTLIASAVLDFFPIEGARESFQEAKALFTTAGAGDRIRQAESPEKHGLGLPLRRAVYGFFEKHLAGKPGPDELDEIPFEPRPAKDLQVTSDGQANLATKSIPMLTLALKDFDSSRVRREPVALRTLLDPDTAGTGYKRTEVVAVTPRHQTLVLLINGNESGDWRDEKEFLDVLRETGYAISIVDPRGVGALRPDLMVKLSYTDPLAGVEENIAYNAFLVGKSLLGMRVADIEACLKAQFATHSAKHVIVCGRADAALLAMFAAAINPKVTHVVLEGLPATFRSYFDPAGRPINAASILPNLLRDYGDIKDVLAAIAPRKVWIAEQPLAKDATKVAEWMGR